MSKFCQKIACCIVIPSIPGRFYPSSTATQKKKKAEKKLTLPSQPLHSTTDLIAPPFSSYSLHLTYLLLLFKDY